ncbi:hypothetical protein [Neolewinella persica]|uniref:hypothetical protein n=1 Tax=Neolewinella persica TaxID=70998 RepID=UPI00037F5DD0|nr:hypothetical protein [Neolewinella persica]
MTKPEKRVLLNLIAEDQLNETITQLIAAVPEQHPDLKRINQLAIRLREMEERIDMGTLSNEDIGRVRSRIAGGLKDVIQELKPMAKHEKSTDDDKPVFKLNLTTTEEDPSSAPKVILGFDGDIQYKGSPSKKERSIELVKGYGAAYHQVLQGIKKAGMTMEKADRAGGRLSASMPGTSSNKFGEVVEVWLKPERNGRTWVHVVVDSALPTTAFDFGRHESKLNLLFSYLR